MVHQHTNILVGIACGALGLLGPTPFAWADTPLTHADIQEVRNQVDFIPEGSSARLAQISDRLAPGDALSTYQSAFAELEFNDGSLARVGELVLFRFQPDTRTFELDNGTLLLLIPPGQGRSRVRTPNATAGIRGSGLFVRHIEGDASQDAITVVGALTTSGITVSNFDNVPQELVDHGTDTSETSTVEETTVAETTVAETTVELEAGHMAVIVGNEAPQLFTFDLELFYETSALSTGLDLEGDEAEISSAWQEGTVDEGPTSISTVNASVEEETELDPIALVREETEDGLRAQIGTLTSPYIDNPPFITGEGWIPDTALLSSGENEATQSISETGGSVSETIDALIDAADIQSAQPTPPIGIDVPAIETPATPRIPGPEPVMGPAPSTPGVIEPPSPPNAPTPPSIPTPPTTPTPPALPTPPEPPMPIEPPPQVIPETPIPENPAPPVAEPPTPPEQPDVVSPPAPTPPPPVPTPEEPPTQVPPEPTPEPVPLEPSIEPGPEPSDGLENPGPAPAPDTSSDGSTPEGSSPPDTSDVPANNDAPVTPPITNVFPDVTNDAPETGEDSSVGPQPMEPIEGGFEVNPQ